MRSILRAVVLFIVALIVSLIATLPARLAVRLLPDDVPVVLQGAEGTIWSGSATGVLWQGHPLGKLAWEVHTPELLLLRLATRFTLTGDGLQARGKATLDTGLGLHLSDTLASADLANLPLPLPQLIVTPEGLLNASIRELSWEDRIVQTVDADLLWRPAKITAPAEYDLGEVELRISGEAGNLAGTLASRDGPLDASGGLTLDPNGLLKTDIRLKPHRDTPREIRELLPMIGKPGRDGSVTLREQLRIPGWPTPSQ